MGSSEQKTKSETQSTSAVFVKDTLDASLSVFKHIDNEIEKIDSDNDVFYRTEACKITTDGIQVIPGRYVVGTAAQNIAFLEQTKELSQSQRRAGLTRLRDRCLAFVAVIVMLFMSVPFLTSILKALRLQLLPFEKHEQTK